MSKFLKIILAVIFIVAGFIIFYLPRIIGEPQISPTPILTITNDGKSNLIRVKNITSGTIIKSPLAIEGEARGYWFFEASFPVRLLDGNGKEIAVVVAQAQDDPEGEPSAPYGAGWMTTKFVPFRATLTFGIPGTDSGTLVFEKDNPSGLPEHADELRIPIRFDKSGPASQPTATTKPCVMTGCSGQICSDENVITTCEYRAEYACYKTARCERRSNGQCGWTQTLQLTECLAKFSIE